MHRAVSLLRQRRLPLAASLLAMLLASCGGGGGSGAAVAQPSSPAAPGAALAAGAISGYVVEGPVAGATVKLYRIDTSGNKTLLGSAISKGDGYFSIPNTAPANTAILVEATGGSYIDEMTRQTVVLATPLRAVTMSNGAAARVSVTPYSEATVRVLERLPQPDWSAARIDFINKYAADKLGVTGLLDFIPVDLLAPVPATGLRENDIRLSVFAAGFSGYARRFDASPSASLDGALDGLRRMFAGEEHDDRVQPAFVGGVVDFVDISSLSEPGKQNIKTSLLTFARPAPISPMSDEQLRSYRPSGVASGGVTAPMPNDAFQLVGATARGSMFNYRGALVGYPLDDASGRWRTPYMASVAEVYGDGEIGIGRWNGGTTIDATRSGDQLAPAALAQPLAAGSWHYALARQVAAVPACGMRKLALAAYTKPTITPGTVGAIPVPVGLTADSSISFQYAGKILAGFDIGLVAPDGSVTRYMSRGGVAAPWASAIQFDPQSAGEASATLSPSTMAPGSSRDLDVRGLVGGSGAAKFVAKLAIGTAPAAIEFAAAFAAADGVDSSGCAVAAGDPGSDLSPAPYPGSYYVMTGVDDAVTFTGTPVSARFGPRGELAQALNVEARPGSSVVELAGNADASIGRIDGEFRIGSTIYHRSLPYAVARPGAVVPATGTRHYALVASTLVAPELGEPAPTLALPLGRVQSASLDIDFGEYPAGTPNDRFGSARLRVEGTLAGIPFLVASAANAALPNEAQFDHHGATFINYYFMGALAAPNGEYASVRFMTKANGVPVSGTLLLRAQ